MADHDNQGNEERKGEGEEEEEEALDNRLRVETVYNASFCATASFRGVRTLVSRVLLSLCSVARQW